MGQGDQTVQIDPPCLVLTEDNGMVGRHLLNHFRRRLTDVVDLIKTIRAPLL